MRKSNYFIVLVFIGLIAIYFQSIHFDFNQLDDQDQVVNNTAIRSFSLENIKSIFQSTSVGMYQPFTTLIYALTYSISGLNPTAYHLGSLLFHIINCMLLFQILSCLKVDKKTIFLLTAVFAIHPMQVESIAWTSAFSNLVFSSFFMGSLLVYMRFLNQGHKKYYWISLFFFLLSCLSKSTAVVLPLILILTDYFFDRRITLSSLLNKAPFLVLSLVFGIITIYSRESVGHLSDLSVSFSIFERLFLICYSILFYPFKFLLPVNLSVFYPYPEKLDAFLPFYYYLCPILLILLLFILWKNRKEKQLVYGAGFFLLGIAPIIQLIPVGNQIRRKR